MNGLEALAARFAAMRDGAEGIVENAIQETAPVILALNEEQLLEGKNRDGQSLGRYKSPGYAAKKARMNPRAEGRKDYRLTGDYYHGRRVVVESGTLYFYNLDEKAPWLERYADRREWLNEAHRQTYFGHLRPVIAVGFRNLLKLS